MSDEPADLPELLPDPEIRDWYFTFGSGQYLFAGHRDGEHLQTAQSAGSIVQGLPLENRYVVIRGGFHEARARMYEVFGQLWCDQYADLKSFASYYPQPPRQLEI
jgi:hypothetical protein